MSALGFTRQVIGNAKQCSKSFLLFLQTRADVGASKQFVREHCGTEVFRELKAGREGGRILGVVESCAFLYYMRLGYDWLGAYYNPGMYFDEVRFYQAPLTPHFELDFGYPFHIHHFRSPEDLARQAKRHGVSILRAYSPAMGRVALAAASGVRLPVVISVH